MRELILDRKQLDTLISEMPSGTNALRFQITVTGSCMLPFIRHEDVLTVAQAKPARFRVGDILVYRSPGRKQLFAHRLVSIRKKEDLRFETRGDATFGAKEDVPANNILGYVVSIQRNNRQLNPNHPCRRIAVLLWIAGSPLTTFFLCLARRTYSFYNVHLLSFKI